MLQSFASEQVYLSRSAMKHRNLISVTQQWTLLHSNTALEYKYWQWWLGITVCSLLAIALLVSYQHGDQRLMFNTILIRVRIVSWTVSTKIKDLVLIIAGILFLSARRQNCWLKLFWTLSARRLKIHFPT